MRQLCGLIIGASLLLASPTTLLAQNEEGQEHAHEGEVEMPQHGVVILVPTEGNRTRGVLRLEQTGKDLKITGRVRNLTPGEHGFHIHEFGDLRSRDGSSAGGHFNPYGHEHGAPGEESHVGDLGNITANEEGVANIDVTAKNTALHFVLGRAFVVHAGKDDLKSQPSGDAGPRVALGIIGVANPEVQPPQNGNRQ